MWGKAEKHFLFTCQTLERSEQVKIIIITNRSNKIKPGNNNKKKTPGGRLSGLSNNIVLIFQLPYIQAHNQG